MNERQPYEENIKSRLNDLPIPDEDQAWQKMKLLLDDDDDDRVPPLIFLRSCMGWGLMLLTALVIVWLVFHPERQFFSKEKQSAKTEQTRVVTTSDVPAGNDRTQEKNVKSNLSDTTKTYEFDIPVDLETGPTESDKKKTSVTHKSTIHENPGESKRQTIAGTKNQNTSIKNNRTSEKFISGSDNTSFTAKSKKTKKNRHTKPGKTGGKIATVVQTPLMDMPKTDEPENIKPANTRKNQDTSLTDSTKMKDKNPDSIKVNIKKVDSPVVHKPRVDSAATAASPLLKKNYFSAGIGLQQQLPIAGQKSSPYNIYGRKGSLGDYIPSVYIRYHKEEKWLIHAEFRYGAPQNVKEVAYGHETFTHFDSTGGTITSITTTNTTTLKKTFYHQVPVSFDYFIRPGWTAGAGFIYSKFFSAVSEEESHQKNNITQAETVNNKIVQTGSQTDSVSAFTKSLLQFTLSTEYTWKRLSGGLRYAKGLQPFIRYTTASGEVAAQKNQSFNVFLRFRLWKQDRRM